MYIPAINAMNDPQEVIPFMQQFSFATLVTIMEGRPVATPLPFIIKQEGETIVLYTHMARANPQWKFVLEGQSMVIFAEPHAYISPTHYDEADVPTWNYVAVHAYGNAVILQDAIAVDEVLAATISQYEPTFLSAYRKMDAESIAGMQKGVVALKIPVLEIQAKKKISQNRSAEEQLRIINTLSNSEDSTARQIAEFMRREIKEL